MTARRVRHVTPSVVARWLEVKQSTVCAWITRADGGAGRRRLPAVNIGTRRRPTYLIFRPDLREFLLDRGMTEKRVRDLLGA